MTVDHEERLTAAITRIADQLGPDDALRPAVAKACADLPRTTRDYMAQCWLADLVRNEIRTRTLRFEREAEQPTTTAEEPGDGVKHGSVDKRRGGVPRGCTCLKCEEARTQEAECAQRLTDRLSATINTYVEEMKIQWTAELLSSTFARPDGTRVTWGDASIDDHRERAAMFEANAHANIEGAARHIAAINDLEANGAHCLNALASVAA